jgi:hypothetical protein
VRRVELTCIRDRHPSADSVAPEDIDLNHIETLFVPAACYLIKPRDYPCGRNVTRDFQAEAPDVSHQEALTVLAEIPDHNVEPLKQLLGNVRTHAGYWNVLPFAQLPKLHAAQLVVFDAATDLDGNVLPARLALVMTVDAPLAQHIEQLSTLCAAGMDTVFSHCSGYPPESERSSASRRRFLEERSFKADALYINKRGRTVQQIRQEDRLRLEIGAFLDSRDFSGLSALQIRREIVEFVRSRNDLSWALRPVNPPTMRWRFQNALHGVLFSLLAILLSPLLVIGLPIFVFVLRHHEKREKPDTSAATADRLQALRNDEDYWVQNQMMALGCIKRGLFRRLTARGLLGITNYATRHVYNRGSLSGLNTIHFARWVRFDGGRRMFFSSIYDGSVENYMNDFIDKAAWGVNGIFGNGDGFPPTAYLFGKGITDEKAYKRFLPTRLLDTNVWYTAYPHLTTKNIANNEAIRRGLSHQMTALQTQEWLKRFGVGNGLPASGWVARKIDGLPWDRICRRLT